ncbi:MAG: O-antigen ligase family protein [Phycisphaerales bacterium]|nr:MAG: O-antigen ligase family protein [Phycisphaerales bacterium]
MGLVVCIILILAVVCVLPFVFFLFGARGTGLLFFAAAVFPAVWLSRFDRYSLDYGDMPFSLTWGVLASVFLLLILFGNPQTRRLLSSFSMGALPILALLLAVFAASTLANRHSDEDVIRGFHASLFVVLPPLAAWAVIRACKIDESTLPRLVGALLFVGAFVSLLAVLTAISPGAFSFIVTTYKTEADVGRAFSPIGGPSGTAMCLLMVYCLAVGQFLTGRRRGLALFVLALCFLGLLATLARAVLLAFLVVNVYLWARHWRGLGRRMTGFVLVGLTVLVPLGYGLSQVFSLERFGSGIIDGAPGASLETRSDSLVAAVRYGAQHPALGGGWGLVYTWPRESHGLGRVVPRGIRLDGYPSAPKPHSLFALVFAEGGVIAFLVLMVFCWQLSRGLKPLDATASPVGHSLVHGFRAGFLSFMVMCVVQDHLFLTSKIAFFFYLFILTGIAVGAHYRRTVVPALPAAQPATSGAPPHRRAYALSGRLV